MTHPLLLALHLLGGFLLFAGVGALCFQDHAAPSPARRPASIAHGIALLLILLTGLLLLGNYGLALWVWLKILVWLALGAAVVVIRRAPGLRPALLYLLPLLGFVAAWLGLVKPG